MMANDVTKSVEDILELAAKWQIPEAITRANNLSAQQSSEDDELLIACRSLLNGTTEMQAGLYAVGIRNALPALSKLERQGYRPFLDWAYSVFGSSLGMLGIPEMGLEWVNKAIEGAKQRSDEAQLHRSLNDEGQLFAMLADVEKSI